MALILLVDDDIKVLRLLEASLRLQQHHVAKEESGAAALAWLTDHTPDLIVANLSMPDLDGLDFLRRVRQATASSGVPFIFLSARSEPEEVVASLREGANEFLRKPFSIDELLVRVERLLRGTTASSAGRFDGDLARMPMHDVLRMLSVQRQSGLLVLTFPGVAADAELRLWGGQVTHAVFGALQGEAALFAALPHQRGQFRFQVGLPQPERNIGVQTLPLLMEGFRLLEERVVQRVDPSVEHVARNLRRDIEDARAGGPQLPAIDEALLPALEVQPAFVLTDGRPAPGAAPAGAMSEEDVAETQAVAVLDDDEELAALLARADRLLDEGTEPPISHSIEEESPGFGSLDEDELRTEDHAAMLATGELARLEGDRPTRDAPELPTSLAEAPVVGLHPAEGGTLEMEPSDLTLVGQPSPLADGSFTLELPGDEELDDDEEPWIEVEIGSTAPPPPPGTILVEESAAEQLVPPTGVALVDESLDGADLDALQAESDSVMALFEQLKIAANKLLSTREVQLSTRKGVVIASVIEDGPRREAVAQFARNAIAFSTEDATGLRYAVLDAGALQVVVVAVDDRVLATLLFAEKPEVEDVLNAVRPVMQGELARDLIDKG